MLGTSFKKQVEVLAPFFGSGRWQAVNQIEGKVVETSLFCPIDTLSGMVGIVTAAQIFQIVVKETLDADAQPVDAQFAQALKVFGI